MVVGTAEVMGGLLVMIPQTSRIGAILCLVDAADVFALNMTYDVPVKLFSFQLLVLSLVLLAPDLRRLTRLVLLNRPTEPSTEWPLFHSRRKNRIAVIAQGVFGVYLVSMNVYDASKSWTEYGGGAPKPPLYGIWNVEEMTIDGQVRAPLLSDGGRWRRVVFSNRVAVAFQQMDDTTTCYRHTIDTTARSLTLTKAADANWKAPFSYEQPAADQLILAGDLDGHKMRARLKLVDHEKFLLVSRGFHWVQERPFNR
jgi:hypothetical protein